MKHVLLTNAGKAAVCACALFAGTTVYALVRVASDAPTPAPPTADHSLDLPAAAPTRATPASVATAVEANPFSPTRARPTQRYLLPGEVDPEELAARRAPPVAIRVLGTVVANDSLSSFITGQVGNGQPTVVRLKGSLGDYTLVGVTARAGMFVSSTGEKVTVQAQVPAVTAQPNAGAGPPPFDPTQVGPGGRGGRGGAAGGGGRGGRGGGGGAPAP